MAALLSSSFLFRSYHPPTLSSFCQVRVQTVAPVSASMYRYANTLSWTQFKKYFKRGYDVQIELVSSLVLKMAF
jgi:predicted lipase